MPGPPPFGASLGGFVFVGAPLKSFFRRRVRQEESLELNTHPAPAVGISAVILAAGSSARMGRGPKLLLDIGGAPMIRRTVENVLEFGPVETVVVTGRGAADIEAALAGLPVAFVHNPDHEHGQPTSVAAGVKALSAPCRAVMIVLGDQPLVTADHLRALAVAYEALEGASILVPHHRGRRGNPVVIGTRHIPAITGGGDRGRPMIDTGGDDVGRVEFDSDVFVFDCDTPRDYRRLLARLEQPPADRPVDG